MRPGDAYATKAEDFARYRPAYAPAVGAALSELTGLEPQWVVADIASGTGNVTVLLLDRVATLFAVEPCAEMRRRAEERFVSLPSFHSIDGTAEQTGLEDRSVDLIAVGQALHWLDAPAALREFTRVLRPEGWLAVVWNRFTPSDNQEVRPYLAADDIERRSFPVTVHETWEEFIGGARSASHNPSRGDPEYSEFEQTQRGAFDARARDGRIEVQYRTELTVGRLRRG